MRIKKLIPIVILILLVIAISTYCWPARDKEEFHSALKNYCSHNGEAVLERYYQDEVIHTARISKQQFDMSIDRMPIKAGWLMSTYSKCWVPHHRIRFIPDDSDSTVEICFTCDEIWTKATGRRKIPEEWKRPLRELFSANGIPETAPDNDEYLIKRIEASGGEAEPVEVAD